MARKHIRKIYCGGKADSELELDVIDGALQDVKLHLEVQGDGVTSVELILYKTNAMQPDHAKGAIIGKASSLDLVDGEIIVDIPNSAFAGVNYCLPTLISEGTGKFVVRGSVSVEMGE